MLARAVVDFARLIWWAFTVEAGDVLRSGDW